MTGETPSSGDFDYVMYAKDASHKFLFSNSVWMASIREKDEQHILEVLLDDPSKLEAVQEHLDTYNFLKYEIIISPKKTFITY